MRNIIVRPATGAGSMKGTGCGRTVVQNAARVFFVSCVTFLVPTRTSTAVSPEASLAQLVEHVLRKRMSWVRSRQVAFRCPSPQQALVPVRTSQSRRPAAAVIVPLASRQRVPSGFPMPLAGEPALQDSVTEWLR